MAYTLCSTCEIRPAQPGQRKCKECHAQYMRQWRARRVSVELADDTYEWVRRRSGQRKESVSEIVAEALRLLREADDAALRERAAAVERGITAMVRAAGAEAPPEAKRA